MEAEVSRYTTMVRQDQGHAVVAPTVVAELGSTPGELGLRSDGDKIRSWGACGWP
jgi:hypothetical protein